MTMANMICRPKCLQQKRNSLFPGDFCQQRKPFLGTSELPSLSFSLDKMVSFDHVLISLWQIEQKHHSWIKSTKFHLPRVGTGLIFINAHSYKDDRRHLQNYTGRRELDCQKHHQSERKGT